jgi:uncharacterized protein YjbJ (UPF0337 family)
MKWDHIEGNWDQFKGDVKRQWGKLSDYQLDVTAGKRDKLAAGIQQAYRVTREQSEKQLSEWLGRQNEPEPEAAK